MNVLAIGLDHLMLKNDSVRGDVRQRQLDYARRLGSLTLIIYSSKKLNFKLQQWSDNLWVYPTNSNNKASFVLDAYKIASRICKQRKIDVITTEDPFTTGFVGYLLKKRYKKVLNVQSHVDFCDNKYWLALRKVNKLFNILGKFILKHSDTIRVGTNFEKEKLIKKLNIAEDKISVIPVNCEIRKFKDVDGSNIRNRYLNGRFDRMLLFTGRLVAQKDIPTLLNAFSIIKQKMPKTLLMIIGAGSQDNLLKKLANRLGISNNVIFTNSIEHNKIPEYVSACDVYAISSIFEGTCIAMAEAMAASKPVVATKFAGAIDLIQDGVSGFIVNQKDHKNFADKVLYLLNNPDKAKLIVDNASRFISERFENNKNINGVIQLWEKTAKK